MRVEPCSIYCTFPKISHSPVSAVSCLSRETEFSKFSCVSINEIGGAIQTASGDTEVGPTNDAGPSLDGLT
jgi:hypothetical protein